MLKKNKDYIYSLLLCIVIGLIGKFSAKYIPFLGSVTIAIVLGIIVRNSFKLPKAFDKGFNFAEKRLLPTAIAMYGVKLNALILSQLGMPVIFGIVLLMSSTILLSFWIGRFFGFSKDFSLMLGTGNAVCGSSAIAAAAPLLKVDEDEVGLSVGVVNLMGTIGLFAVPFTAVAMNFSDLLGGFLAGGTLQSVGQAVAAGAAVNDQTCQFATIIKMGRVLMLGPVLIALITYKRYCGHKGKAKGKFKIPLFIFVFVILAAISSTGYVPDNVIKIVYVYAKFLLLISMAAIGLKIHFKVILNKGTNAVLFGLVLAVVQFIEAFLYSILILR